MRVVKSIGCSTGFTSHFEVSRNVHRYSGLFFGLIEPSKAFFFEFELLFFEIVGFDSAILRFEANLLFSLFVS